MCAKRHCIISPFLQCYKIPFDLTIPLLGIYPKKNKSFYYKDTCTHTLTAALFTIAKSWNQSKCPSIINQINKMWYIHTMEYYAAMKMNEIMSFAGTWMEMDAIILSTVTQKTKHCMFSLISGSRTMRTPEHRKETTLGTAGGGRGVRQHQEKQQMHA
uniref:DUF1725 domain-containing protein n=1 Tax=Macaca fascicularis TaxID=9541 RepID=A0A7N9I970_MACFA